MERCKICKNSRTRSDIDSFSKENKFLVSIPRPTNGDHIANCSFIDSFQ